MLSCGVGVYNSWVLGGAGFFWLGRCRVEGLGVLGCSRYRLLPPVTGGVRGIVARGNGAGVRCGGARVDGPVIVVWL